MSKAKKTLMMWNKIAAKYPNKGVKEVSAIIGVHFSQFYRWQQGQEPSLESYFQVEKVFKGLK